MSSSTKRVAIYYEHRLGRNDGFPLYAFNLLKDKKLYPNLEAVHLVPNGDYKPFGRFDANLWVDWGEDGLTNNLPYQIVWPTDAPLIYYASDTHLGKDYRFKTAQEKGDYVFFAQKPAVEEYKPSKKNKVVEWLPHGVEPRAFPSTPKAMPKYDVSFVGHLVSEERIEFLDRIFKEFPNFWFGKRLSRYVKDEGQMDDCADIFRKSKIVLNPPTKDDVNMRHFEACAAGAFQLTKWCPGLEDLFEDGKHLVMYKTVDEAIKKIRYYLENDKERQAIADAGYSHVIANHTYKHRLDVMLKAAGII